MSSIRSTLELAKNPHTVEASRMPVRIMSGARSRNSRALESFWLKMMIKNSTTKTKYSAFCITHFPPVFYSL